MSRIGKQPISIPDGVTLEVTSGAVVVKGPKGELVLPLHHRVSVLSTSGQAAVSVNDPESGENRALWGLFQRLVRNMVLGVTDGFSKQLEINGVGYKAAVTGNKLVLNVGYSHPVEFILPAGITAQAEKSSITISGIDKQLVGELAAKIRRVRPPEPYKGKGIKYSDEVIRRKAGKQATKK